MVCHGASVPWSGVSWPRSPTVCVAARRAERSSLSSVARLPCALSASTMRVRIVASQTSRAPSEKYSGDETAATGLSAAASAGARL